MRSYRGLDAEYVNNVVDHAETYVDRHVHTNGLEENGYVRLQTSLDDRFQLAETGAPLAIRQDVSCSILHSSPVRHGDVVALFG